MAAFFQLLAAFLPTILKFLGIFGGSTMVAMSAFRLALMPEAPMATHATWYGTYGAAGLATYLLGEWSASSNRRAAVGSLDVERLKKIIALLLQLFEAFMPDKASAAHKAVAAILDSHECETLGVKRHSPH